MLGTLACELGGCVRAQTPTAPPPEATSDADGPDGTASVPSSTPPRASLEPSATATAELGPHPFSVRDLLGLDRISQLALSPDGQRVAFVSRRPDLQKNALSSELFLIPVEGGTPRALAPSPSADHSPVWSPDGRSLYFLSNRERSTQVWRIELDGDAVATPVTDLPLPVSNLAISPTGDTLLFSLDVFPDCPDLPCTAERTAARSRGPSGTLHRSLFVRHWDTDRDGRRSHLFALQMGSGPPRDLTAGLDADVPSTPFGGPEEYTVSPDGTTVVFAARNVGREEAWSTNFDLYAVPITGGALRRLTATNPAWDSHPRFTPDGQNLVWLAMARPGYESDRFVVMTAPWPWAGPESARALTSTWDASPHEIVMDPGGDRIWVTAAERGQHPLFEIALSDGEVTRRTSAGSVSDVEAGPHSVVFLHHDLQHPGEVHRLERDSGVIEAVSHVNEARLAEAQMGTPTQFDFAGARGERVYGYVVTPANFDPTRRYPIAFVIHGGPQGSFGNMFHYRWNAQMFAGMGYAVVAIDFHGSTGYGQAFVDSIRGDWGGKPLEDLKRGLAHALRTFSWLDGDRVCALGASYGGFMVNWIESEWRDRFNCLVNHDGIFDQRMMYYATEELWFPEWEHKGVYGVRGSTYERFNPATAVARWKTPMLVIHGALDYRVPLTQGIATFTALQRRGIESELLVFPDENHWVLKPRNAVQWHETVQRWLDRYLTPEPTQSGLAPAVGGTP